MKEELIESIHSVVDIIMIIKKNSCTILKASFHEFDSWPVRIVVRLKSSYPRKVAVYMWRLSFGMVRCWHYLQTHFMNGSPHMVQSAALTYDRSILAWL